MNELKKIINTLKGKIQKTKAKIAAVTGVIEESISEVRKEVTSLNECYEISIRIISLLGTKDKNNENRYKIT